MIFRLSYLLLVMVFWLSSSTTSWAAKGKLRAPAVQADEFDAQSPRQKRKKTRIQALVPAPALQMEYLVERTTLDGRALGLIEGRIGYVFKKKSRLIRALTARSIDSEKNYERYEFLGDKILDLALTELLLHRYKGVNEGHLSAMRSSLVRQESLASLCLYLDLHRYLQSANEVVPISSLCDIVESLLAAISKDGGHLAAKNFVSRFFTPMFKRECLKESDAIIKIAAREQGLNIVYRWTDDACEISQSAGSGQVSEIGVGKKGRKDKDSPIRLARYSAEKIFIEQVLAPHYANHLVRLPTDPGYHPAGVS